MLTACMSFPVSGLFETVFCDPMADRKQGLIRSVRVPMWNVRVPTVNVRVPTGNVRVPTGHVRVPMGNVKVPTGHVRVPTWNVRVPTGHVRVPTGNALLYMVSLNRLSFSCVILPRRQSGAFVGV